MLGALRFTTGRITSTPTATRAWKGTRRKGQRKDMVAYPSRLSRRYSSCTISIQIGASIALPMKSPKRTTGFPCSVRTRCGVFWKKPDCGNLKRAGEKGTFKTVSRTAEEPGQAVNEDLCFVPASHEAQTNFRQ